MRGPLTAAAAALAFASAFLAAGAACAATGASTPVYVPITMGPAPYVMAAQPGPDATMDLALQDGPLTTEGEIARGDVIGQRTLKARAARVLTQAAEGIEGVTPEGTALARVTTDHGRGAVVWCDIDSTPQGTHHDRFDCFADSQGKGRFDQVWIGVSPTRFTGLGPSYVMKPRTIASPAAFRDARPEESPSISYGYQWCDGDLARRPIRFAAVTGSGPEPRWDSPGSKGCVYEAVPDAQHPDQAKLDGLAIELKPGATAGRIGYRFMAPDMMGGRLALILSAIAPPPSASRAPAAERAPLQSPDSALIAAGDPTATGGSLIPGQSFFSIPVRHGLTGVLKNEVRTRGWFADRSIAAGQPVYGVPMAGSVAPTVIWCAPRIDPSHRDQRHWVAVCLPESKTVTSWVEAQPALMTLDIAWVSGSSRTTETPIIERGPVDLPPMTLSYAYGGWTKSRWMIIQIQVDWGEGPQTIHTILLPPGADGSATLKIMGGEIVLRGGPAPVKKTKEPERITAEVRAPPRSGGAVPF